MLQSEMDMANNRKKYSAEENIRYHDEKKLDNNKKTDKNTISWRNGSRHCRGATHSAVPQGRLCRG